ncbi:glycosyltransferase family 2 protein [Aeromicrobium sp. zg-636]|uniref:Glycosyltransferase family 2 protein n=1 Tax=Aeromicrobium senzhongii TaxID=2663859 RepID=A0A8I0EWW7_9ACTN|nr:MULTISPECIES: glycosyltransferase family 2 protein [Aeromicrobium]MBC9226843.1 glycosyltransferase family 2 protein [Aeromicrobium senzhongii]
MTNVRDTNVVAVVLNWRDTARTIACAESLTALREVSLVVVVDNESDGELAERVGTSLSPVLASKLRIVPVAENRGFAGGVNVALRIEEVRCADMVLAINNDAVLGRSALVRLRDALVSHPAAGAVGPIVRNVDGTVQSKGAALTPTGLRISQVATSPDYLTWACVLLRGQAMREVGLLDEQFFMYWEDYDYGLRLKSGGWGLLLVEDADAVHELSASGSSAGNLLRTYYAESLLLFAIKWRANLGVRPWVHFAAILGSRVARRDGRGLLALLAAIPSTFRYVGACRSAEGATPRWALRPQKNS